MSERKMIEGLASPWGMKDADLFQLIDKLGGWPVGYLYVGFEHTDERNAGFCNSPNNSGWWTVLAHADDYYLWKLSPAGLQRITNAVTDAYYSSLCGRKMDAQKLSFRTWRNHVAAIQKEPKP